MNTIKKYKKITRGGKVFSRTTSLYLGFKNEAYQTEEEALKSKIYDYEGLSESEKQIYNSIKC